MLGLKKDAIEKAKELGYKKDEEGFFYTKIVDGMEITFEKEGVITMCKEGGCNYFNSDDERFNQELIQDLIDNDLVEDVQLYIGEDKNGN